MAVAHDEGRIAAADAERVVVSPEAKVDRPVIVHDAKAQRLEAKDDTLLLAYLIEPSRPEYPLEELEAEYGLELEPDPPADEETTRLVRNAAATFRLRDLLLERVRERDMEPLYRDVELPLSPVLAAMEAAGPPRVHQKIAAATRASKGSTSSHFGFFSDWVMAVRTVCCRVSRISVPPVLRST